MQMKYFSKVWSSELIRKQVIKAYTPNPAVIIFFFLVMLVVGRGNDENMHILEGTLPQIWPENSVALSMQHKISRNGLHLLIIWGILVFHTEDAHSFIHKFNTKSNIF